MYLDNNNHSVFLMYYHLVLVIKYRRKAIDDRISVRLKEIFEYIAPKYNIELQEWNHDKDHVHILFKAQPGYSGVVWFFRKYSFFKIFTFVRYRRQGFYAETTLILRLFAEEPVLEPPFRSKKPLVKIPFKMYISAKS